MATVLSNNGTNATENRDRQVIEFRICKAWRAVGKLWTDAELEAAVESELAKLAKSRAASAKQTVAPKQLELVNTGRNAASTRHESLKRIGDKSSIKRAILEQLSKAGRFGATRFELAAAIGCQQSSLCSTAIALLNAGEVVELPEKRASAVGGVGCVLVLSIYMEGRQSA